MGRSAGQTGGILAIVLSSLWALPAAAGVVIGVMLVVSDRNTERFDPEGFGEFVGGGLAVAGGIVLAAAVLGIVLGARMVKGRVRIAPAILFSLFAAVSGMFLISSFADDTGADVGGIVLFGANTLSCVLIAVLAVAARRDASR